MLLVGFTEGDGLDEIKWMVNKIVNLRIFDDEEGVMNKSILDVGGKILSISQFTLYADTKKGNRPSFIKALEPTTASEYYDLFCEELLKDQKVAVVPGNAFNRAGEGYIRIACTLSTEKLVEAAKQIVAFVDSL